MKIMQKEMPSSIDFNKTMASRTQSVGNSSHSVTVSHSTSGTLVLLRLSKQRRYWND